MNAMLNAKAMKALMAAAWLANAYYGRVQLKRVGDMLEVVGTDNYVLMRTLVDCQIDEWQEGDAIVIKNASMSAEEILRLTKRPLTGDFIELTVDDRQDKKVMKLRRVLRFGHEGTGSIETRLNVGNHSQLDLSKFDDMPTDRHEGHIASTAATFWKIGKVIDMIDDCNETWTLHDCGPFHAYKLTCGDNYIVAMPVRDRQ